MVLPSQRRNIMHFLTANVSLYQLRTSETFALITRYMMHRGSS
jgi:hypothetical protein